MSIDFINPNAIWASVLVETLVRLGLQTAIASPGCYSTSFTFAVANPPEIDR